MIYAVDLEVMDKCPEFQMMLPCQCKEKKNGLDITCENVETSQLQMVTDNMKEYIKIQDFTVRKQREKGESTVNVLF